MNRHNNNNQNGGSKLPPVQPMGLPPVQPVDQGVPDKPTVPAQQTAVTPVYPATKRRVMSPVQPVQMAPQTMSKKKDSLSAKPNKDKTEKRGKFGRRGLFWIIICVIVLVMAGLGVGFFLLDINSDNKSLYTQDKNDYHITSHSIVYVYKIDGSYMGLSEGEKEAFINGQGDIPDEERWFEEPTSFM